MRLSNAVNRVHKTSSAVIAISVLVLLITVLFFQTNPIMAAAPSGGGSTNVTKISIHQVDLSVTPVESLKLIVVGEENTENPPEHFPSGWGIKAELELSNNGTEAVFISKGTRILSFNKQNVDVVTEQELVVQGGSTVPITAYFDSDVLDEGLNEISFLVDPDGQINELDEENNAGFLKLFHPSAYPDIVITKVEATDMEMFGVGDSSVPVITVGLKNIGGDMTRTIDAQVNIRKLRKYSDPPEWELQASSLFPPPYFSLKRGESTNIVIDRTFGIGILWMSADLSNPMKVEIRLQDTMAKRNPYAWAEYLQDPEGDISGKWGVDGMDYVCEDYFGPKCVESPLERGSEDQLIGHSTYGPGYPTPPDYSGANAAFTTIKTVPTAPYVIYPSEGKTFLLGKYPPVWENWLLCPIVDCIPKAAQPKHLLEHLVAPWRAEWKDSLLNFRWLPAFLGKGLSSNVTIEILDSDGELVHSITHDLSSKKPFYLDGKQLLGLEPQRHYLDIYNYQMHLMERRGNVVANYDSTEKNAEVANDIALMGRFMEYVYDGPPLLPGKYGWRIKWNLSSENEDVWAQGPNFVLKADEFGPGTSPQLKDNNPFVDDFVFRGKVTNVRPGGFTVGTSSGLVHVRTDSNTQIWSPKTHDHEEVPLDWKVHVQLNDLPYISGRAYVPEEQIPVASSVTEFVTNRSHKRCTAVGKTSTETTAFSCDDGDYVELNEADIPDGASAVILVQFNGSPKLVSTATSLYNRMERFKSLATSQNNGDLSSKIGGYQGQASSGFKDGFESAKANASPEVLQLLEMMGDLSDRVSALAKAFTSGGDQLIVFDSRDKSTLKIKLQAFAETYETIIDFIVHEILGNISEQEQNKVITDIRNLSTQFLADMKADLGQAVYYLDQSNLLEAITVLDKATANEEQWEQQIVQPRINISLAQNAIDEAKEDLLLYGDSLSKEAKTELQSKLDALNTQLALELQQSGSVDLMPFIQALWDAMGSSWDPDYDEDQQFGDLKQTALGLINEAESTIKNYGQYLEEGVEDKINSAIADLQTAIGNGDDAAIQKAVDSLANTLGSSGSDSQENLESKALNLISEAESTIKNYGQYLEEGVKDKINSAIADLQTAMGNGDDAAIQKAIDSLVNTLASSGGDSQDGEQTQSNGLVTAASNTIDIADGIIQDYGADLPSELFTELKDKTEAVRTALNTDNQSDLKSKFDQLTSVLQKLKDYTPKGQLSIEIQCASEIVVGIALECSSKHDKEPDQISWSAPDGSPASGTGNFFQTSFSTTGQFSISIEACVGSVCATDVQSITVIPEPSVE